MNEQNVRSILDTIEGGQILTVGGKANDGGVVIHGWSNIPSNGYERILADDLVLECLKDETAHILHVDVAPRTTPGINCHKDCFSTLGHPSESAIRAAAKALIEIERIYTSGIKGLERHWAYKAKVIGQSSQRS